jgi:hypothetical protein
MMFDRHFKWKSECAFRYIGAVDLRRLDLSDLSVQVATISHRSVGRQTIARNAVVAISTATASHLDWLWGTEGYRIDVVLPGSAFVQSSLHGKNRDSWARFGEL